MMENQQVTREITDDTVVAETQYHRYKRAYDRGHEEYMKVAKKCADFYVGKQWDDEDRRRLEAEGRPVLTINTILSTINTVLGEQVSNRLDVRFKPRRTKDDPRAAAAMTQLFMQIADANMLDWVESEVFADGIIEERGYFDVRMNFDENTAGDVVISAKDPKNIVLDPDAKEYDPATWKEVWESSLMSLEDIANTYGKEKADELSALGLSGEHIGRFSMSITDDAFSGENDQAVYQGADGADQKTIRSVRVIERQYRKTHYVQCFVDQVTGDTKPVPDGWGVEQIEPFRMKFGLGLIKKIMPRVRWTVTADRVVLHDDWSPYNSFTIIPFFPYFRRGRPFGVVSNLLSPQEQLNKVESQELHIVNTTANSGWIVEDGSLTNMTEDDLAKDGAKTGLVLVHGRNTAEPKKIQPNQIPSGIDRIGQKAAANIRGISGVNDGMLGMSSAEVSGVALQEKRSAGNVQIQVPKDNLARTRNYVARQVMELVQQFYTDERTFRITDEYHPEQGEQELAINQPQEDGSILNDMTLGKYDIVITTMPSRDNFGDIQFAESLSMREVGIAIPDHIVVGYSNLARKHEVAEQMKQMAGLGEPTQEEQEMQQIQMQLQMEGAQLEVEKLAAERDEIKARAELQMAKAEQVSTEDQMRMRELDAKISSKREELLIRLQLAQMTNRVKQQNMGVQLVQSAAQQAIAKDAAKAKAQTPTPKRAS